MHKPPMKLFTPTQAGRLFTPQVGPDRVRDLCDRGELRFIRAEGRYGSRLIFEDSIEDYLARRNLAASQEL